MPFTKQWNASQTKSGLFFICTRFKNAKTMVVNCWRPALFCSLAWCFSFSTSLQRFRRNIGQKKGSKWFKWVTRKKTVLNRTLWIVRFLYAHFFFVGVTTMQSGISRYFIMEKKQIKEKLIWWMCGERGLANMLESKQSIEWVKAAVYEFSKETKCNRWHAKRTIRLNGIM